MAAIVVPLSWRMLMADMNRTVKPALTPVFRNFARTILPIEVAGRVVQLEAKAYEDGATDHQAIALVQRAGDVGPDEVPVVRVHSGCVTGDIFHSLRCDCYQQLQRALEVVTASRFGIIVYLPNHEGRGIGLVNKIKAYAQQDRGLDTVDANISIGEPVDSRDYLLAANILKDLECRRIRLMTNNPLKVEALRSFGIEIVERLDVVISPSDYNARYLKTKKERMAHKL
jgi:GTP cyclohydrolase II